MKYILWGAGERGKRILSHIGKDAVVAFTDADNSKCGKVYLEKPVVSLEDYQENYSKYPLLLAFVDEISGIEYCKANGIENYYLLSDCPGEFQEPNSRDLLKKYVLSILDTQKTYGIYGCTVYSLKVYDWIVKTCQHTPWLLLDESIPMQKKQTLEAMGYQYIALEKEVRGIDCTLVCTRGGISDWNCNAEVIHIYDCSDRIPEYYNPQIERFKNLHAGERCFLVATGPSLRMADLEILKKQNIPCFSMNHIYKALPEVSWRPDYYVVADNVMCRDYGDEVRGIDASYAFISDANAEYWMLDKCQNHFKMHEVYEAYSDRMPEFSEDISRKCYQGYTVTYTCMQLAAYMGFKEIYLLGVDFSYGNQNSQTKYEHFFKEGKLQATGYVTQVTLAYEAAKQYADTHGIKIYNATRGGKLEIFPRVVFDVIFKN